MSPSSRPLVFGDDAAAYDRARPDYPGPAIDHLLGLVETKRVVEVGAGTGKATVAVARPGLELICIEPSGPMADILEGKDLPGVLVARSGFEEWEPDPGWADLLFAAQAWHWVDETTAYDKVRSALRPDGALALLWNLPQHRYDEFADVYRRHAPQILEERDERIRRRDHHDWLVDMGAAGFADLDRHSWQWTMEMTASEYRELYSTYSDHMLLPDTVRHALLDDLEAAVAERGGTVVQEYTTDVFSGRNRVTARR